MPALMRHLPRALLLGMLALTMALTAGLPAQGTPYVGTNLDAYPPNLTLRSSAPMMMLTASKDHTLFAPIYTDYEDLDGDGVMDNTFRTDFQYYGYFDAKKCYR